MFKWKVSIPVMPVLVLLVGIICFSAATGSLMLSGGSDGFGTSGEPELAMDYSSAPAPYSDELTVNRGQQESPTFQTQERIVLRTARMSVISEEVSERMAEITAIVEDLGGWVVNSSTSTFTNNAGNEVQRGTITVRVPAAELDNVMNRITDSVDEVRSSNISGEDVTQQFVDQQSRLRNLEAAEEQLQTIMDDANTTQNVLSVYNELVRIRGEIEVIQGQLNYWSQAAAYSSLQVDLEPPAAVLEEEPEQGWSPGESVENAAETLIDGLKVLVDAVIWIVIFLLPFAVIFSIAGWMVYRLLRRFYPAWFASN